MKIYPWKGWQGNMDKKKMTKKGTHIVKRLLAVVCCAAMMLGLMPNGIGVGTVQAKSYTDSVDFNDLGDNDILAAGTTITDISLFSIYYKPNAEADTEKQDTIYPDSNDFASYQLPQKIESDYDKEVYIESTSWTIYYAASNSAVITVTIKEKTPQKGVDYDYTMAELLANGTTKLAAGTKIYQDERIFDQGQYAGSYEYGIAKGYITDDSSKVQNYETYKGDYELIKQAYKHPHSKGEIITLRNSYEYDKGSGKTITGDKWYVYVTKFSDMYEAAYLSETAQETDR